MAKEPLTVVLAMKGDDESRGGLTCNLASDRDLLLAFHSDAALSRRCRRSR